MNRNRPTPCRTLEFPEVTCSPHTRIHYREALEHAATRQAIKALQPLGSMEGRLFDKRYRIDFHLECVGNEASKRYGDEISPPLVHMEPIG